MAFIECRDLHFSYSGESGEVLHGVDLDIEKGSFVALLGHNGCGKSTMAKLFNGMLVPTSGTVTVDGIDTAVEETQLDVRRRVGLVQQNPDNQLVAGIVEEDVAFGPENLGIEPAEIRRRVDAALKAVNMYEYRDHAPHKLSGGQKQRVAIARALATNPHYLLCDEATSALDPTTTGQILELLAKINRELGVTIIVITHEMKVIDAICHRVAVIDRSHIAEEGPVSEVFVNPQSAIAQELILQKDRRAPEVFSGQRIRIVFDDKTANKPVISDLILACQAPVNIIFADTREVGGIVYGHMIVQLPQDERQRDKITAWLHANNITFKEEV